MHPFGDPFSGVNEIGEPAEVDRHRGARFVPSAGLPQFGDGGDLVSVAQSGEGVVVEVAAAGAHRSDGERVPVGVFARGGGRGCIVAVELHGDRCDEVEISQAPPRTLGALAQRRKEHLRGFGNEGVAEPTVRKLTGEP